jgi:phage terminase large subunit-like protein
VAEAARSTATSGPSAMRPHPGPQAAFDECEADLAIFGGSPGGGKSQMLLWTGGKWVTVPGVRGYRAVLFRRTTNELTKAGGLWDRSQTLYRAWGGRARESPTLDWIFEASTGRIEDRHRISFRHLQHEDDVYAYDGGELDFIGFDELQQFTAAQFWYLVKALRSSRRGGVRPHMRASCNPDPDSFLVELLDWWIDADGYAIPERSGVVRWVLRDEVSDQLVWYGTEAEARAAAGDDDEPLSVTFILCRLEDNPSLAVNDPGYKGRIRKLPRAERVRLIGEGAQPRGGNWRKRPSLGLVLPRAKFRLVDGPPSPVVLTVRFWDKGASAPTPKHPHPDWSRGVRVSLCEDGEIYIDHMVSARIRSPELLLLMSFTNRVIDGPSVIVGVFQDTGGAGKMDADTTTAVIDGADMEVVESNLPAALEMLRPSTGSSRAKRALANAWATDVEEGRVCVKRDAVGRELVADPIEGLIDREVEILESILGECDAFPHGRFDDVVDAIGGAKQVIVRRGDGLDLVNAMKGVRVR